MRKSISAFILVIGLLMTLFAAAHNQLVPTAHAHSGTVLSAWAKTMPKIDGYREPRRSGRSPNGLPFTMSGEYDDAYKVDFTLTYGSDIHPSTLWVKNDYVNLYVAVEITNEEFNSIDSLFVSFDNDHDGVKETGDDILYLSGGGSNFIDEYYNAGGSNVKDTLDGGTRDGAGAAGYKTSTSTWVFEMVHPLNTGDDAHDFSLSIGSTVGVNLFYYDGAGGVTGWPAFTSDWTQMADIVIAGPPSPPPSSTVDLTITGIEVTQAVQTLDNSLPLVQGKDTVVRVYVSIGPVSVSSVTVWIYLYGVDGNGRSFGLLSGGLEAPKTPDRSVTSHTANFLLPPGWVNSATLVLKAFVKAYATTQAETNYNNNWMAEKSFALKNTNVPTIYIVPINRGTISSPNTPTDAQIQASESFLETIFPVGTVNFVKLNPWIATGWGDQINRDMEKYGIDNPSLGLMKGGINQIYGISNQQPSSSPYGTSRPQWGGTGWAGIAASGCISSDSTMAHEITHNLGPWPSWGAHLWNDVNWPYPDYSINEIGLDTRTMAVVSASTDDLMRGGVLTRWVSPYRWENLFNRLDPPEGGTGEGSIQQVGESLLISGWIGKNGTGSLDPISRLSSNQTSASGPGSCSLVLKNINGTVLLTHTFQAQFVDTCEGGEHETDYFVKLLPNPPGTAEVLLYANSTLLARIGKTTHAPTVQLLSPNGGEVWNVTGVQTIRWIGNDTDLDPLTYWVYYSADNGTTWTRISPDIRGTSFQTNASLVPLKGSDTARIRVVATDGFNVGIDVSNGVFRVSNHPPTAEIVSPRDASSPGAIYCSGVVTPFIGTGTDPDETLPESAFSWTSDLDGFIGYGRFLLTPLYEVGLHRVTLTVTDSQGATATDTITVNVVPWLGTVEIPNAGVVVAIMQTAVGQGYTAKIRLLVSNVGTITQSFDVTALANGEVFQTVPVLNLPSGNSTYMELLWSTAGKPKGVYNITATVTLPEYEITWLLETMQIAIIGDITGPTARVPDGKVDIRDLAAMAKIFGVIYPNSKYDSNCDITGPTIGVPDDKVDIRDLAAAAKNFGKIDP